MGTIALYLSPCVILQGKPSNISESCTIQCLFKTIQKQADNSKKSSTILASS